MGPTHICGFFIEILLIIQVNTFRYNSDIKVIEIYVLGRGFEVYVDVFLPLI